MFKAAVAVPLLIYFKKYENEAYGISRSANGGRMTDDEALARTCSGVFFDLSCILMATHFIYFCSMMFQCKDHKFDPEKIKQGKHEKPTPVRELKSTISCLNVWHGFVCFAF